MRLLSLFLCLCLVLPTRADDPIRLVATFSKGDVVHYDFTAKLDLKSDKPGQEETLNQQLRLRFTAAEIRKDGATVRAALEQATITYHPAGEDAQTFEWREGEAGPEEERPLAKLYRTLGNTVFELSLDSSGNITNISGLDRVTAGVRGLADPVRAMGILAPEAAQRTLQPLFSLDPQGTPRSVGDEWSSSSTTNSGIWRSSVTIRQQLKSLVTGAATITGASELQLRTPKTNAEDLTPRADIAAQSSTIESIWDTAHSRLTRRVNTTSVTWRATIPVKEPISTTSTATSHIEIKLVEP